MSSIEGKVIIVTGATSGIGEGCSQHFAEVGARVVMASNQPDKGQAMEQELQAKGLQAHFVEVDVADECSVKALMDRTVELFGRIDAVDSNAGVWRQGKVTDFTVEDWDAVMGVNVMGNLWLAKHAIPVMESQGKGVIVITTSVAAFVGFPQHALYCSSKAALEPPPPPTANWFSSVAPSGSYTFATTPTTYPSPSTKSSSSVMLHVMRKLPSWLTAT